MPPSRGDIGSAGHDATGSAARPTSAPPAAFPYVDFEDALAAVQGVLYFDIDDAILDQQQAQPDEGSIGSDEREFPRETPIPLDTADDPVRAFVATTPWSLPGRQQRATSCPPRREPPQERCSSCPPRFDSGVAKQLGAAAVAVSQHANHPDVQLQWFASRSLGRLLEGAGWSPPAPCSFLKRPSSFLGHNNSAWMPRRDIVFSEDKQIGVVDEELEWLHC